MESAARPTLVFSTSYRKTQLAPDELIRAVCLKKQFSGYYAHTRKVGAQRAGDLQSLYCGARADSGRHCRRYSTRHGKCRSRSASIDRYGTHPSRKPIDLQLIELAKMTAAAEVQPIDDIRSSARYRAAVAGNLVAEFG